MSANLKLELPSALTQKWQSLSKREQNGLKFLSVFVLLGFLYLLVLNPLWQAQSRAEIRLQQAEAQWRWLNSQRPQIAKLNQSRAVLMTKSTLMSQLQHTLRQYQLPLTSARFNSESLKGKSCLTAEFSSVAAPKLFFWLSALAQNKTQPLKASIENLQQTAGYVKAKLWFEVLE